MPKNNFHDVINDLPTLFFLCQLAPFLTPRELIVLNLLARFSSEYSVEQPLVINSDAIWRTFLIDQIPAYLPGQAKTLFLNNPSLRLATHLGYDAAGRQLIDFQVAHAIYSRNTGLSLAQKKHLQSNLTKQQLYRGETTLTEALARSFHGADALQPFQLNGIKLGLTKAQVSAEWFQKNHLKAQEAGCRFEDYQQMNALQVELLIQKSYKRRDIIHLSTPQLTGLHDGFSLTDVIHADFEQKQAAIAAEITRACQAKARPKLNTEQKKFLQSAAVKQHLYQATMALDSAMARILTAITRPATPAFELGDESALKRVKKDHDRNVNQSPCTALTQTVTTFATHIHHAAASSPPAMASSLQEEVTFNTDQQHLHGKRR